MLYTKNYYAPPIIGGAYSDDAVQRLSVWPLSVAYIGPKSRTERPRKTKIGTEVAHDTRDSDTTVKGQGHQAALLTTMFARRVVAALSVGTCWPWETAAILPSAQRHKALRRPRGRRGAGAYRGGCPLTACYNCLNVFTGVTKKIKGAFFPRDALHILHWCDSVIKCKAFFVHLCAWCMVHMRNKNHQTVS